MNNSERITVNGYRLDEVVSALQKAIRRGKEERALFFAYEMIYSGYIKYFWKRISVIVVEDVGLANIDAINVIASLILLNERVNKSDYIETFHPTYAVLYLCRSTKSREIDYANHYIDIKIKQGYKEKIESYDLDEHTDKGRQIIKKTIGNYSRNKDEIFYYQSILLNKPASVENDKYKRKVWEIRQLDTKKFNYKLDP